MIVLLLSCTLFASGIDSQVKRFFEENNVDEPLLTPEKASHPALPRPPPLDYVEGGIETANGKRMIDSLAKIAISNREDAADARTEAKDASAFAYLIAMDSISSLASSVSDQIQTWANQLNTMALLSEIADQKGMGVFARAERLESIPADRFETRRLSDEEAEPRNIGEEALQDLGDETRELFLTITGSIVLHPDRVEFIPPRHKETVQKLAEREREKIGRMLREIQGKLRDGNTPFSEEEKKLIHTSRFPLASLMTLMTQYRGSAAELEIERFGHLIGVDRTLQFVHGAAEDALTKARAYAAIRPVGEMLVHQIEQVLEDLKAKESEQQAQAQAEISALELMLQLDGAV